MRRVPAEGESGQITAMLVIFALCLLMVVIAVTDLSAAYLRRQSAASLADGAALAAVSSAGASAVYQSGNKDYVIVDRNVAVAAVDAYLRTSGAYAEHPGLRVQVAVTGPTVRVAVAFPYRLPVPLPGAIEQTTVHAAGSAQMPIY